MTNFDKVSPAEPEAVALGPLLGRLRELIVQARTQALRAVDAIQVHTCWEIGRYIVEFEQQGQARATYGARLLPQLAGRLTQEFGRGFDARNLRHMRTFYQAFPIWDAVRTELSWTHYRTLLRVESETARQWYVSEAVRPATWKPDPHASDRCLTMRWQRTIKACCLLNSPRLSPSEQHIGQTKSCGHCKTTCSTTPMRAT